MLEDGANSRLYIANAGPHDSGNYTCALSEITNSTVTVVVLNGKEGYYYPYIIYVELINLYFSQIANVLS